MSHEATTRVIGIAAATSLHLVVGWAIWSLTLAGTPARGPSDGGKAGIVQIRLIASASPDLSPPSAAHRGEGSRFGDGALQQTASAADTAAPTPPSLSDGSANAVTTSTVAAPSPSVQTAELPDAEVLAYRALLEAHLARFRVYPAAAKAIGTEGVVVLHFVTDRQGKVLDAWVENSSGVSSVDAEALKAVTRAQPLPAYPRDWPPKVDFSLPVVFKLS
jgi:protein TonB